MPAASSSLVNSRVPASMTSCPGRNFSVAGLGVVSVSMNMMSHVGGLPGKGQGRCGGNRARSGLGSWRVAIAAIHWPFTLCPAYICRPCLRASFRRVAPFRLPDPSRRAAGACRCSSMRRLRRSRRPAPCHRERQGVPWLYRGSDVPVDREWKFGELPNGLRYAVRKNGVPPGQVSIRIRVDAGSLYEAGSRARFCPPAGTSGVPPVASILATERRSRRFQRLGATFGSDTNAETSPVSTTYKLDLPDATDARSSWMKLSSCCRA
jgi:hypothetical protein